MNKFATFKEILAAQNMTTPPGQFILNLLFAALFSFLLGRLYVRYGRSLSNRRDFAANFVLISATTMLVISIVKSSLSLSLGMVGALSIVRFRAAIKEPEELAYLFLNLGIGLGFGAEQRLLTILALGVIAILIVLGSFGRKIHSVGELYLVLTAPGDGKALLGGLDPLLTLHARGVRFRRLEERNGGVELAYVVEMKGRAGIPALREEIKKLDPQASVSFLDGSGGF